MQWLPLPQSLSLLQEEAVEGMEHLPSLQTAPASPQPALLVQSSPTLSKGSAVVHFFFMFVLVVGSLTLRVNEDPDTPQVFFLSPNMNKPETGSSISPAIHSPKVKRTPNVVCVLLIGPREPHRTTESSASGSFKLLSLWLMVL